MRERRQAANDVTIHTGAAKTGLQKYQVLELGDIENRILYGLLGAVVFTQEAQAPDFGWVECPDNESKMCGICKDQVQMLQLPKALK